MCGSTPRIAILALVLCLFAAPASAQRGKKPPVLIPPGQGAEETQEPAAETPPPPAAQPGADQLRTTGAPAVEDPKQPRTLPGNLKLPYTSNRPLIQIDGNPLYTAELNQLVAYYQSFRPGSVDLQLRDAVSALLPSKLMAVRYKDDLPAMRERIDEALDRIRNGELSWADAVAEYSDDTDEENPEGKYVFGRERAVQPFDRLAHSGRVGQIHGPFLTVYGYHFLEILDYERGAAANQDQTTVRHVLVMYPDLKKRDAAGEDIRAYIKKSVREADIQVLERGAQNLLAPPPLPKTDEAKN